MAKNPAAQHDVRSPTREQVWATVRFDPNTDAGGIVLSDNGNIVSAITYAATGVYTVVLADRWDTIHVVNCVLLGTSRVARPTAVVSGVAAANSVTIQGVNPTTGATSLISPDCHLTLSLSRN